MQTLLLTALFPFLALIQTQAIWGAVEPGPHAVGYKSSIAFDPSRPYGGRHARPILMNVWYPAAPASESPLPYAEYLRVPTTAEHPWFQKRLEAFVRGVLIDDLFHKKAEASLTEPERAAFQKLLATSTVAHAEAPPASGRFPVVLYHPGAGGSFEENSILFEYLASHGYVVVSSAYQSPNPDSVGNNIGGIERSGPDLDFIAKQTRTWSNADSKKIAAVGHSAGAQNIFQWIGSPKCPARAFVSLDTTAEYAPYVKLHKYFLGAINRLTPPRIPVLLFARARDNPDFLAFARYLRHAPHYEAQAAELHHDDFLTHGYLGRILTQSPDAATIRTSYENVCKTIRLFLDASLKDNTRSWTDAAPSGFVSIRYKPAR